LASKLGLRQKLPESNWLSHIDVENILKLQNFELISIQQKIIFPFYIPLISNFLNRYIAPLPFFNFFCLLNIAIARPLPINNHLLNQSVSIVIPSRNESENIRKIINRIPKMGENDEIIFIEGGSSDNTWNVIQQMHALYGVNKRILIAQQKGIGKGDAVREGFKLASNEILMILDADMTVAPEDLSKFYDAIRSGKGEFINGSRLVYPMENGAMQFLNLLANKFFAISFAFILGQRFKDTLCGTKVISRINYLKLSSNRSFFGDFDPFGDFDLIFGAARMGLKIIEVPIIYRERVYGKTNISRWKHGSILLYMLFFSAKRIKFI
jgi:glycosyltransferase involved in cell wall biosynthesis